MNPSAPPPILLDDQGMVAGDVPCRKCSYNLRGLPIDSRCTQCATQVADSLAGKLAGDVPCRGCSYNLRGLPIDSKCPECATAVAISLQGNLLRYSDPRWLNRLAQGAVLIACALLFEAFLANPLSSPRPAQRMNILAASLLAFAGTWLLTLPDPAGREEPRIVWARRIARFGFAMALIRSFTLFFVNLVPPQLSAWIGAELLLVSVARVAGELARLYFIRKLAQRIPDLNLDIPIVGLSCIYVPGLAVLSVLSSLITLVQVVFKQTPPWLSGGLWQIRFAMTLARVFVMLLAVLYATLMIALAVKLWSEAKLSQTIRARAKPDTHETSSVDFPDSARGGGVSGS